MQPLYTNGAARIGACLTTPPAAGPASFEEPDYTRFLAKNKLRRLDRLSRFALHTTYAALAEAEQEEVNGVIMGVGQTTSKTLDTMLRKMIVQQEGLTNPTSFMNSLLSTAAGQIALQLSCSGYTNTHTQRGFSVESALLDASLQLRDNPDSNIVVGGLDVTHESYAELSQNYGHLGVDNRSGIDRPVGEGAATFVVSGRPDASTKACIREIYTAFLTEEAVSTNSSLDIQRTLFDGLPPAVDLIVSGRPAGNEAQRAYDQILAAYDQGIPIMTYKEKTGEFPTASAHGLYLAVQEIDKNRSDTSSTAVNRILVVNNYGERYLSALLVTRP